MPKSITITFPHQLGVAEAKQRISAELEAGRKSYVDKIGSAQFAWVGDTGHLKVSALGQTTTATIDVKPSDIRVEIHLPWLLAAFSDKIASVVKSNTSAALKLAPPKKA
jgi:hypothetical protein